MLKKAIVVDFNWDRYHATGRSFGFAEVVGISEPIFFGTDFRVRPVIEDGEVKLGLIGQDRIWEPFQRSDGPGIMMDVLRNEKGLFGRWCFRSEWNAKVSELEQIKKEQERLQTERQAEQEKRMAELRLKAEVDPSSLDQALQNGWIVFRGTVASRQVVVTRPDPKNTGKMLTKTFHQSKHERRAASLKEAQMA